MKRQHVRTWTDPDGHGFRVELYDTYRTDRDGKSALEYEFYHHDELIFEGSDFFCPPTFTIDGDRTVGALLGFFSLRPGDTDKEYFEDYTKEQLAFAREWGETLSMYVEVLEGGD